MSYALSRFFTTSFRLYIRQNAAQEISEKISTIAEQLFRNAYWDPIRPTNCFRRKRIRPCVNGGPQTRSPLRVSLIASLWYSSFCISEMLLSYFGLNLLENKNEFGKNKVPKLNLIKSPVKKKLWTHFVINRFLFLQDHGIVVFDDAFPLKLHIEQWMAFCTVSV